jgi:ubiquinone/menaquinone biosynthesis C-methylase UbiE
MNRYIQNNKGKAEDEKMKPQVEPTHYFNESYDAKERFISYWHQINEIIKLNPKRVLEIGIGNGFVSKYLKERSVNITTLDIDRRLNPNIGGSVLNIPFSDKSFDVVSCYELLEHLPYENFNKALSEIHRISEFYAILSIPDARRVYRFSVQIPKIGYLKLFIPFPQFRKAIHKFGGEHYWEIGKPGYPLKRIVKDIQSARFKIKKTYRVFEFPYHRFFILIKV